LKITFLSPRLPPSVCGVGDHTVQLASSLRAHVDGVTAIYLHGPKAASDLPFDRIDWWDGQPTTLARLVESHATDCLWVQYSGYGFAYQGVPEFLVRSLRQLRGQNAIVVYFHQVHCRAKQLGWKGLIISPYQFSIAKRIAKCADLVITSCDLYRNLIAEKYSVPSDRLFQMPIGSNIPVPVVTFEERARLRSELGFSPQMTLAVAFGTTGSQQKAIHYNRELLEGAVQNGQIDGIVCLGGAPGSSSLQLDATCEERLRPHITVMGHQTADRIAEILLASDVALTAYPSEKYGKSGAMMAYAMAGLPVLISDTSKVQRRISPAAAFIRTCSLRDLTRGPSDHAARVSQQKHAASKVGWPAIATQALQILDTRCSTAGGKYA
jgi:glycosyltransferase involved in cell wall biosynthesis